MLFMVIERFSDGDMVPAYQRLREKGRSLPEGLEYVDSWVEPNCSRCFQLMRCDDPRLFQEKTRDAGAVDLGRHGQFAIEAAIDDDLASLPDLRLGGKEFRRHAPDEIGSLEPVGVDGGQRNQEGRPNHGRPKGARHVGGPRPTGERDEKRR